MNAPGQFFFDPPFPVWLIVGLGTGLAGLAVSVYWRTRDVTGHGRRGFLLALRLGALAGLVTVLLRPMELQPVPGPNQRPVFHVMVDASSSMNTVDCGVTSRWAAVRAQLRDGEHDVLDALARHYEVQFHEFDGELRATTFEQLTGREEAPGRRTDLAAALGALAGGVGNRPQAGVLLVSDGRDNAGGPVELAATTLKSLKMPVWTTAVGTATETKDVSLTARLSQNFLFAKQPAAVRVDLTQSGYANWYAKVTLLREDQPVTTRQVVLKEGANRLEFPIREEHKGVFKYTVAVEPLAGEADRGNNRRALFARVVDQKPRVLLVEAEPYWETKFLQRALHADPNLEITSVFQLSPRKVFALREHTSANNLDKETDRVEGRTVDALGATLPQTKADWFQYDCVIFGHGVDALLGPEQINHLRDYLSERGGSIVCARGRAYDGTNAALAALEPVAWAGRQVAEARLELTTEGRLSPIFAFNRPTPAEVIIRELPSMISLTRVEKEKSLAVILARGVFPGQTDPLATIAYQRYGRGKVMSIGATGLWRWAFLPEDQKDKDDIYRLFWAQMIRWLIDESDFLPGQDISFRTDRYSYSLGEKIRFSIHTKQMDLAQYRPFVELTAPGGGPPARLEPVPDRDSPNVLTIEHTPTEEGEYSAILHNNIGQPSQDTARFTVYSDQIENRFVAADRELLARVAEATGGAVLALDQWAKLPEQVRRFELAALEKSRPKDAWDRGAVYAALLGVLALEWFLRRRWGLA